MKNKLIIGISVVALILAGIALYNTLGSSSDTVGATPGSLLIEQYDPYVNQNGGIKSALPIQTTSTVTAADITAGATTLSGTLTVTTTNTATSSASFGCVAVAGTSTATQVRLVLSTVATSSPTMRGTNTVGLVGWQYGTCP